MQVQLKAGASASNEGSESVVSDGLSSTSTLQGHEDDMLYRHQRNLEPLCAFHSHDDCWSSLRNFAQNITLIGQGVALVRHHGSWHPFICNTTDVSAVHLGQYWWLFPS